MINAICTWGDGPDVVLDLNGSWMILLEEPSEKDSFVNGVVRKGNTDLTVKEARDLAYSLLTAANEAEILGSLDGPE